MKTFIFLILILATLLKADFNCGRDITRTTIPFTAPQQKRQEERQTTPFSIILNVQPTLGMPAFEAHLTSFQIAADIWTELLSDTPLTGGPIPINADVESLPDGVLGATGALAAPQSYASVIGPLSILTGITYPASISATTTPMSQNTISLSAAQFRVLGTDPQTDRDGDISFSTDFPFDVDLSDGLNVNQIDFLGVAVHEIGHLLGFTSTIDDGVLVPTILDVYRFNLGPVTFTTTNRVLSGNTDHQLYSPLLSQFVGRLARGVSADGNQASHWRANEDTGVYVGIMDPTLGNGELAASTAADDEAFELMGYSVNPSPCPFLLNIQAASPTAGVTLTAISHLVRDDVGVNCLFTGANITDTMSVSGTISTEANMVSCVIPSGPFCAMQLSIPGNINSNAIAFAVNGAACGAFDIDDIVGCRPNELGGVGGANTSGAAVLSVYVFCSLASLFFFF